MLKTAVQILFFAALAALISCASSSVKVGPLEPENKAANNSALIPTATPQADRLANENASAGDNGKLPGSKSDSKSFPDDLVKDLYRQADSENNPFFQDKNRALVDKYFVRSTADLIWKDALESQGEVGALEADPLYDAQDTDITNFKVGAPEIKGDRATVAVTFENFRKMQTIKYQMIKVNGGWKIEDIVYRNNTLLKLYRQNS